MTSNIDDQQGIKPTDAPRTSRTLRRIMGERGVALVIVLAFVVLLTGLVVAYFARTITDRQLSNSSFDQAAADQLARSALALLTSDLKQEIINGSTAQTPSSGWPTIYLSSSNAYMVPVKNGVPPSWATPWSTVNTTLLRVSSPTGIAFPGVDQIASNAASTGTSANGRSITTVRWNQHYLLPLASVTNPSNTTPSTSFTAPSWVYITGTGGPTQLTSPSSGVVGRYAYAIYDEGALLDVNAAGFPAPTSYGTEPTNNGTMPAIYQAKGGTAFADLTSFFTTTTTGLSQSTVNTLVGWRNLASLQPTGTFPSLSFSGTNVLNTFSNLMRSSTTGFLAVSGSTSNGLTDQAYLTRQELINIAQAIGSTNFNLNNLQYLGTFSRAVTAPSWSPPADSTNIPGYISGGITSPNLYKTNAENAGTANRDLANVRFQQSGTVTHYSDGIISGSGTMISAMTSATYNVNAGDPLMQSRFSLAKIAWLSQADPSAGTNPPTNYAMAIQSCFGLTWGVVGVANGGAKCWSYAGSPGGTGAVAKSFNGTIETLDQVAQENREPNFFEVLKAAILNGSLGISPGIACYQNGVGTPFERGNGSQGNFLPQMPGYTSYQQFGSNPGDNDIYSYSFDRASYVPPASPRLPVPQGVSDVQIMQIGANIIDQYDADSYPTAIYFKYSGITSNNDAANAGNQVFGKSDMVYGDENLPYMMGMVHIFATTDGGPTNSPGSGYDGKTHPLGSWWQPLIWNPHQMPNPANSSFAQPKNFQINGYAGAGGLKLYWSDAQYNPAPPTPPEALPSDSTNPVPLDNDGTPLQYISFTDASPATSAFYAQPLLLTSSGISNVTASSPTSYPQMMASTYPSIVHESQNPFIGFWAGTDPKYMGGTVFIDTQAQVAGAVTFCLGWKGTDGNVHPYSFLPGEFSVAPYGVIDNGPRNGTADQGGALPQDASTSDHILDDPLLDRFGTTANWEVGSTTVSTGIQTVATYYKDSSDHNGDTYDWGQPYSPNFFYTPINQYGCQICDWEVNSASPLSAAASTATYYKDPDGVVRPGDGFLANASTGDGMLLYTSAGKATSGYTAASGDSTTATSGASGSNTTGNSYHGRRQVILNRPFRSVGELGYTYRDLPFKTLDFFSTSSADAALLDVFSVNDQARVSNGQLTSVVAGEVNLNDAPVKVITALLAGGSKKDFDTNYYYSNSKSNPLTNPNTATSVAQNLFNFLNPSSGNGATITNRAELVTRLGATVATGTGAILNSISAGYPATPSPDVSNKAYLEAPVRALADATNTRTWNLMIDVVAQAGSFTPQAPATAAALNSSFNVTGERRYWLHIAIDRMTGKVVDEQLEPVYD